MLFFEKFKKQMFLYPRIMAKNTKENRIMTIALTAILIVAGIAVVYVSMTSDEDKNVDNGGKTTPDQNQTVNTSQVLLSVKYGNDYSNYSLENIENLTEITGSVKYLKMGALPTVIVDGPYNYTGVSMVDLLDDAFVLPDSYNVTVTASDGRPSEYTYDEIQGRFMSYNESTGNESGIVQGTMLLAYKEDNTYLDNESGGPLKIVFTGDDLVFSSKQISKYVVSIEINGPEILNISYNGTTIGYSQKELEQLTTQTQSGRYLKMGALPTVIVDGPYNYTGVSMVDLLDDAFVLPDSYNVTVTASDGRPSEYTYDEIQGRFMSYNESTGNESGIVQGTMLLAYKEDETYLNESTGGPLKIVFTGNNYIFSSRTTSKYVVEIDIIET